VSNWDNDAYFDDDTWFQAVTYDQTNYQDLDAYLEAEAPPGLPPAGQADGDGADDSGWDPYAGYDEFGYLGSQSDSTPEADSWQQPEAEPWQQPETDSRQQPEAEPWQQPETDSRQRPEAEPWQQPRPEETWTPGAGSTRVPWRPHAPARSRWLLVGVSAVAAATLGFSVVILTHTGHPSLPPSALPSGAASPASGSTTTPARPGITTPASPGTTTAGPATASPPPITRSAAQQVLAAYTAANNSANAQASQSLLATVEAGGSLAIDSGIYDAQRASHSAAYPAFGPVAASYYIPLESPAAYPHWFAVRVTNALRASSSSPSGKVINTEYLLFTQASAGAPWLNSVEPFILPSAAVPSVALDASGYATAIPPVDPSLALPVATAAGATATALDSGAGQPASPGNLADEESLVSLRKSIPSHPSITSRHSATTDPVFGLRTADGGALLFYDVAARLTLAAQPGGTLRLDIPGFMSPGSKVTGLTLNYLEQFAVDDPPAARGTPAQVIADYSGLIGSAG
jgi:hypothetical protein